MDLNLIQQDTVARVARNLADFNARDENPAIRGDVAFWAGVFSVNLDELLKIIEKLTRPQTDRLERELSASYAGKHEVQA